MNIVVHFHHSSIPKIKNGVGSMSLYHLRMHQLVGLLILIYKYYILYMNTITS